MNSSFKTIILAVMTVSFATTTYGATSSPKAAAMEFYAAMPYEAIQQTLQRLYTDKKIEAGKEGASPDSTLMREFSVMKSMARSQMKTYSVVAGSQSGKWGVAAVKVESASELVDADGKPKRRMPASLRGEDQAPAPAQSGNPQGAVGGAKEKVAVYQPLYCYKQGDVWKIVMPSMMASSNLVKQKNADFAKMQAWYKNHQSVLERKEQSQKKKGK